MFEQKCLRLLKSDDMHKLLFYSSRIKSIELKARPRIRMEDVQFHKLLPPGVLFPRLLTLRWWSKYPFEALFISRTTGSLLRQVEGPRSTAALLHLQEAPTMPSLVSLGMKWSHSDVTDLAFCPALLSTLRNSMSLRDVCIRIKKDEDFAQMWKALSELPLLATVKADIIVLFNSYSCSIASFASLTSLIVQFQHIDIPRDLFQVSTFPRLQRLSLQLETEEETEEEVVALFEIISSSCRCATLISVDICISTPMNHSGESSGSCSSRILRPFLRQTRMHRFEIELPCWFLDLDDDFISDMLHAWPSLCTCVLNPDPFGDLPQPAGRVTFKSLETLATLCPNIRWFGGIFNADPVAPVSSHSRLLRENRSFKTLDVGRSPIHSAPPMAAFLSGLFPSLTNIAVAHSLDDEQDVWQAKWYQVKDLLPTMKEVRREERELRAVKGVGMSETIGQAAG